MVSFVYGFSSTLSEITSKMMIDDETDVNFELVKHDGCFFGNANDLFGGKVTSGLVKIEENNYYQYCCYLGSGYRTWCCRLFVLG